MENSSPFLGLNHPPRSISLPSRSYPNAIKIEEYLNKLKTKTLSRETPLNIEAIQIDLVGLAELYNSVQELIQSSTARKDLLQHQNGVIIEEALQQSVVLLDSCSNINNLMLMIKENVQNLQSAVRRKSGNPSIKSDIEKYRCFRKKVKKDAAKGLRKLKQFETKIGQNSKSLIDSDYHLAMVIRVLREVTGLTISVLKSLLLFLCWSGSKTKSSGWSFLSKLMLTKSAVEERGHIMSDFESVEIALSSISANPFRSSDDKAALELVQRRLMIVDVSISSLETSVEYLFRQLVRYRVSFLNIITPS